jgi:hypothetical protein
MRSAGIASLVLVFTVLLGAFVATGCVNVSPGDVAYTGQGLRFMVHSEEAVPNASVEAAVFRDNGLSREEIYRYSDHVPLHAGDTVVAFPVSLKPGHYQCFIYTSSGTTRFPAVIRDFEVT